jgi:transketolase
MEIEQKNHFKDIESLKKKANWVRRQALEMAVKAKGGHLGGAFSCTEILVALYNGGILKVSPQTIEQSDRDRFILSKGHSCLALYPILADLGFFSLEELEKYGENSSILGSHPDHHIPGIEISSGSLGHGLGIASGLALSAKLNQKDFLTVALLGDGECNEGSVWESAIFASQQKLNNLVAIIDNNKIGSTDFTKNYLGSIPLSKKWESFGWQVIEINGHDFKQILDAFENIHYNNSSKPLVIIANTIKGKGVSFMENDYHWHHGVPTEQLLEQARQELNSITSYD